MSSPVHALPTGLFALPADLDRAQRGLLIGAVVLAHVAMAVFLMTAVEPPVQEEGRPPIEVALISPEPAIQPVTPPAARPAPPQPVPPRPQAPAPQAPAKTTPVLASTAPAQPTDMQAPPTPVEQPPAPPAPPSPQPAVVPANAAPVAAAPAPQPLQPKEMPSAAVRYLYQPPPVYPRVSRELGESGVVKLRLLIDEQGRLKSVEVVQSSGYPRLDQQAIATMRASRFQPLVENGAPRAVVTIAPVVFSLEEQ